jgi:hypothetical protein
MAVIGEVVEILKRWDRWKRLDEAPDRMDALEKRIADLEAKLQRPSGETCPSCGASDYRVQSATPVRSLIPGHTSGRRKYRMKCGVCGFEDEKVVFS